MIAVLLCLATTSTDAAAIDRIVRGESVLPSLRAVQAGVLRTLGSGFEDVAGRARLRGLVPRVDLALGTDSGLDVKDSTNTSVYRTTNDRRAFGVELRMRFDLGDLVLGDEELAAHRTAIARSAALRLALDEVTTLYFRRVEILMKLRAAERDRPGAEHLELDLEAARLDALLRAYAGGVTQTFAP